MTEVCVAGSDIRIAVVIWEVVSQGWARNIWKGGGVWQGKADRVCQTLRCKIPKLCSLRLGVLRFSGFDRLFQDIPLLPAMRKLDTHPHVQPKV